MGAAEAVVVWHMLAMVKAHTCRRPPTNMWDTVEISMWSRGVEISPASSQRAVCCHSCCCCCGGFSPAFSPQHCPTIAPKGLPIGRCCGQRRRLNIAACRLEWAARHCISCNHTTYTSSNPSTYAAADSPATSSSNPTSANWDPFNCAVDAEDTWGADKRAWCCRVHHKGCPLTAVPPVIIQPPVVVRPADPYNCADGYANWKLDGVLA